MIKKFLKVFDKDNLPSIRRAIYMLALALVCQLFKQRKKHKDIWLISERWREARDNGYWLFKHIMENDLHGNTWYVMDPEGFDYHKVEKYSHRVIRRYSLKHYIYYSLCSRAIGTQLSFGAPSQVGGRYLKKIMPVKKTFVYLGHGIQKDDVEFLYKKNSKIDLFFVNGRNEYTDLVNNAGYAAADVIVTGTPRNDGLGIGQPKKEILIMPTNRIWFHDINLNADHQAFLEDRFYTEYQELLDDPDFNSLVDQSGYKVLFFLHSNSHQFVRYFSSSNENIKIIKREDMGVQEALKRTALLVTDYSSVAFDFAYMNKPVIYFQFDYERFRKDQYKEGWFSYEKNGLGDIVFDRKTLVEKIGYEIKRECVMPEKYIERTNEIYKYRDANNCERVFSSIMNIDKQ